MHRLNDKFPNLIRFAIGDFCEDTGLDEIGLKKKFVNQQFLGWIFLEYSLYDGKTVPQLARQTLKLSSDEKAML